MFYSYIRKLNSYLIISGRRGSHESRTSDSISSARTSTCWLTRCHPSPLLVVIIILVAVNDDFVQRPFSNLNCLAGCSIKSFWNAERWGGQEWWRSCLLRPSEGLWGDIHFLFSRIWYVLTFLITPSCILCPLERLWGDFNIFFKTLLLLLLSLSSSSQLFTPPISKVLRWSFHFHFSFVRSWKLFLFFTLSLS